MKTSERLEAAFKKCLALRGELIVLNAAESPKPYISALVVSACEKLEAAENALLEAEEFARNSEARDAGGES